MFEIIYIDAVCRLIRPAYSVAMNNDPFTKYASLCTLQILNGTKLTTSLYQDACACLDFVSLISESLDNCLLEKKIRQSPATGVMIDESTDLSMEKHLIVYVKYLVKGVSCTSFLALIKLSSCDSNVIYNVLVSYLKVCKVDVSKIYGFGSDGAVVMTGKTAELLLACCLTIHTCSPCIAWHTNWLFHALIEQSQ